MEDRSVAKWRSFGGVAVCLAVLLAAVAPSGSPYRTYAATVLKLSHDKPSWNNWYNDEGKAALSAVGVGWTPNPYADTTTFQAAVRTAGSTPKVPDLFTWWSGYLMKDIVSAGYAADVSSIWNKYGKFYPKGVRKAFTFNGKTYGLPNNLAYWVVLYNKHVFAKYHLSPPTTWAQFMAITRTLRSHHVTPLLSTIDGRWPSFIYFEELLIRTNPSLYQRLMAGKAKYTDPGVVSVMDLWAKMIKEGDFSNPARVNASPSGPTSENGLFQQGKAAMIEIGTWAEATLNANGMKPGTDYGAFIMPDVNPKAGKVLIFEAGPLVVAAHGSHVADAMKAADWFMSKAGQQKWLDLTGFTPARSDTHAVVALDNQVAHTVTAGHYKLLNRFWEATPHDIVEVAVDQFAKFMLHPNDPKSILSAIQHQADQTWASNP